MKNVFIANRDKNNAIAILHKFLSIRGYFWYETTFIAIRGEKSWLRFHNNASLLDDLKELNLEINKEPRPIYMHSQLKRKNNTLNTSTMFTPKLAPEIEKEVNKLVKAGFICEVKYPTWIANIMLVKKKNEQLHFYVDFWDLNDACSKDNFPLPVTKIVIGSTTERQALSSMDWTAGCN